MIKAPIDMPIYCEDCYFALKDINNMQYECQLLMCKVGDIPWGYGDKHDNCPLVEVEE